MKIAIMTDLEGTAGVTSFHEETYPEGRHHILARQLAMAEVNAAVDGFLEAGCTDALIIDGHGPGGLWFEHMHPEAKMLHGRPVAPRSVRDEVLRAYDVTVIIGQHAMSGVATSNLNHTQSSRSISSITLNGTPIGEIAQWTLYHGAFGMPLIYLTGEEDACAEAEALVPGLTTVAVKKGLSRESAVSLSKEKARELIRAGARHAVEQHRARPVAPLVWDGPFVLEKRYFHTHDVDRYDGVANAERLDGQTVRITGDNIQSVIYT
jgi:D-amino peptidase